MPLRTTDSKHAQMKLDLLKQFLLSFFISMGLISCSHKVEVIDGITKKPVTGAVISIRSAFHSPFFERFYSARAVSDNSGHAVIERKGNTPRQLIIIKDGYHPYVLKDNTIRIDSKIELCRFDNPSDLGVVDRSVFIDYPKETISQSYGAEVFFKLPLTVSDGPPEAQAEFAIKFKVRTGDRGTSDITSISVVDGKIESHGNDVYLFNCLRSVNPSKDSVDLAGRTTYTFATKRGVYGKLYIFTANGVYTPSTGSVSQLEISLGYAANYLNELESKSTYDGVRLLTEEQILAETRKSGSSDIF